MPNSIHDSSSRIRLVGVPIKSAPALWRRIFSRPVGMARDNVPEHFRSAGLYCPRCGHGQPFSDQCAFCRCAFSSFIVMSTDTASRNERQSNGTVSSGTAKQGKGYGLPAPIHASLVRLSKASFWVRVLTVYVIFLLTTSLVFGIKLYRRSLQRHYQHNYVLALYGIKSGMEMTGKICEGKYKIWKEGVSSDAPPSSLIDSQTLADLKAVKGEIDGIMGQMGSPPVGCDQAAQILQKLYSIYEMMNSMIINSPDSLSQHKTEIDAARENFYREIENLKANLPPPLVEELRKAGKKYDLRFMAFEK